MDTKDNINQKKEGMVHIVLSHSYTVFLAAVVLGLVMDVFIPSTIFTDSLYQYIGAILIIIGSIIIYWAQSTSSKTASQARTNTIRDFNSGPYQFTRNPTHVGLTVMTLGLAFVLNSPFSIIFTIIASVVTTFIFLKKEESILESKYGQPYADYKKKVSSWL